MICSLCHGACSHFTLQQGVREWWNCQACGGAGVRAQQGPATIQIHNPRNKSLAKLNAKLDRENAA
jgi:hypothetical protein